MAQALGGTLGIAVIESDQETALDAGRISAAGRRVVQISTGSGCHLNAAMVARGRDELDPHPGPRTSPASGPAAKLLRLSAVTGTGMPAWFGWPTVHGSGGPRLAHTINSGGPSRLLDQRRWEP